MGGLVPHLAKVDRDRAFDPRYEHAKAFRVDSVGPGQLLAAHLLLGYLNALVSISGELPQFTGGNEAKMSRDDILRDAPMTVEERRLLSALAVCPFPPGSPDRVFCREMLNVVTSSGRYRLTGDQRATLWRLAHQYRARLPSKVEAILEYRKAPPEKSQPGSTVPASAGPPQGHGAQQEAGELRESHERSLPSGLPSQRTPP